MSFRPKSRKTAGFYKSEGFCKSAGFCKSERFSKIRTIPQGKEKTTPPSVRALPPAPPSVRGVGGGEKMPDPRIKFGAGKSGMTGRNI